MKLVVDTNILYSYFKDSSLTKKILMKQELLLSSPEFALVEVNKHKLDILKKCKISEEKFKELRRDLAIAVEFIQENEYSEFLKEAKKISPDPNDIDFLALAIKLDSPLWSNDAVLKKQNKVLVFSTSDLLNKEEFQSILFPEDSIL